VPRRTIFGVTAMIDGPSKIETDEGKREGSGSSRQAESPSWPSSSSSSSSSSGRKEAEEKERSVGSVGSVGAEAGSCTTRSGVPSDSDRGGRGVVGLAEGRTVNAEPDAERVSSSSYKRARTGGEDEDGAREGEVGIAING
jgi:hypothetical protein